MNPDLQQAPDGAHDHPPQSIEDAVQAVARSTVGVAVGRGAAAAFVWRQGWLVAAASAVCRVRGADAMRPIVLPGGDLAEARLQGADPATDIALLAWTGAALPAPQRLAGAPRVGNFVFAVGRDNGGRVHASFGRLGSVGDGWRTWRGGRVERYIRLDGGLYPGLAGAPVANGSGQVIGMASAALSRHHGMVLPFETIDRVAQTLAEHGHVARGYLGVAVQPVRTRLGDEGIDGLLVSSISDDAPAGRAGLMVGDVVTAIGGTPVAHPATLREHLEGLPAGGQVPLTVVRGGARIAVDVVVGEPPGRDCR